MEEYVYCASCGNKLPKGVKFCSKCGKPVSDAENAGQEKSQNVELPLQNTPETVPLIQASAGAGTVTTGSGPNSLQKVLIGITAFSSLCFLTCITNSVVSWISAAAVVILLIAVCIRKPELTSGIMTAAFCLFMLRFLVLDAGTLIGAYHVKYSFILVVERLTCYAAAVLCCLACLKKIVYSSPAGIAFLACCAIQEIYSFVHFFTAFHDGFRSVLFYLGWMCFTAVYGILACNEIKKSAVVNVQKVSASPAEAPVVPGDRVFCKKCGAPIPAGFLFCDMCGEKVTGRTGDTVSAAADQPVDSAGDNGESASADGTAQAPSGTDQSDPPKGI